MSNNIRIEEDLLGTREVPADAYYGVHTLRAIENFYISNNKIRIAPAYFFFIFCSFSCGKNKKALCTDLCKGRIIAVPPLFVCVHIPHFP